jgi:hypothetical protein
MTLIFQSLERALFHTRLMGGRLEPQVDGTFHWRLK